MSFTQAAQELHVSQAAISKQIKYLEDYLECTLFVRNGRRVSLSPVGKQLHQKVSASFHYLADAVEELTGSGEQNTVTIAANTAMSHYWLSNAISAYHRDYPTQDLNIRVITSDTTEDLFADDINISIAYEPGLRADWEMELLFPEELFPVASPQYLAQHPLVDSMPDGLLQHKLLDFERIEPNWINWKVWLEAQNIDTSQLEICSRFNNYIMLIDAAKRGQGITLGTRYLLDDKLEHGDLVRISDTSMTSGRNYWISLNNSKPITKTTIEIFNHLKNHTHLKD